MVAFMSLRTALESESAGKAVAPRSPMATEFVDVDGIRLRVGTRAGDGRPLLLFNGIGPNLDLVQPFVDALDGIEIIAFDLPGTGESPPLIRPRRFSGLATLTTRLLDTLGYSGAVNAVNVAGVSWGGAVAQQFALQYPERCNRLVLAATSAGLVGLPASPKALLHMGGPQRFLSRSHLARAAPEIYGGLTRQRPDLLKRHDQLGRRSSWRGYASKLFAGLLWTSAHKLYRLQAPTLVMGGDDDPIMPLINVRMLHWLIPKSQLHIIRGGGHLFLVVRANECAAVIRRFLEERRYDGTDSQDYRLEHDPSADGPDTAPAEQVAGPLSFSG